MLKVRESVVTGGAVGIGRAIAKRLAETGDRVLILDSNESALMETVVELRRQGLHVSGLQLDLLQDRAEQELERSLETLEFDWLGLVNCASLRLKVGLESETRQSWARQSELATWVPFALARSVARIVRERDIEGSILNVTSPLARLVGEHSPSYHAGKAALNSKHSN